MVIRVVIVAGSRLYRDGLQQLLTSRRQIVVVATAADEQTAAIAVRETSSDVVLFELAVGGAAGARALTKLGIPVVVLTVPETEQAVIACAEAGVVGFVPREGSVDDVVAAIEIAARGETACTPRTAAILRSRVRELADARPTAPARALTAREQEIVELIRKGLSNKEIASRLFIEVPTVKNHVHNILEKLQVSRRLDVAQALPALDLVPGD